MQAIRISRAQISSKRVCAHNRNKPLLAQFAMHAQEKNAIQKGDHCFAFSAIETGGFA